MKKPVLYIVIPCYNEEEVLPETSRRLVEKMASLVAKGLITEDSRVLLFSTEGDTDPEKYEKVVWGGEYPAI